MALLRKSELRARVLPVALVGLAASIAVAQPAATEYEVKAAFVYNFARFVEWPTGTFDATGNRLVIGVLGKDPFGPVLDAAVGDKKVAGNDLVVRRFPSLESLEPCQILFVAADEQKQFAEIVAALRGAAVLTVSESEGFLESGGIINLRLDEQKVRFEINAAMADQVGLKISSQLLKLAVRVVGMPTANLSPGISDRTPPG